LSKQASEIAVDIDEIALAVLGWEGEARIRVTADDWETEEGGQSKVHYSYALSGTFRFNLEEWSTRYVYSDNEDTYASWLLLEIHCPPLGEPVYKEILTGTIREMRRRPLRVSEQGELGYSLPWVDPQQITARITAYDGTDVSRDERFERPSKALPVEVFNELATEAFVPEVQAHAYTTSENVAVTIAGTVIPGSDQALAAAAKTIRRFNPERDQECEIPLPQIEVELLDETGFILGHRSSVYGWSGCYPYRTGAPRTARPPRCFLRWDEGLADLSAPPVKVVVRIAERDG
jgi:hypothetical protein